MKGVLWLRRTLSALQHHLPVASAAVRTERDGPVLVVSIARPEVRNAVDGPTAAALAGAFRSFAEDEAAAVAVLTGEGGSFCAGADLHSLGTANARPDPGRSRGTCESKKGVSCSDDGR